MRHIPKFGIYIHAKDRVVVRINSPFWLPDGPDWALLTTDVNATLSQVRQIAKQKNILKEFDSLVWSTIPSKE
jgi:hypothetical protein